VTKTVAGIVFFSMRPGGQKMLRQSQRNSSALLGQEYGELLSQPHGANWKSVMSLLDYTRNILNVAEQISVCCDGEKL